MVSRDGKAKTWHVPAVVIAALVIGTSLPYKQLIASIDEAPGTGPEMTLDEDPF
jgi:hypothetical protein